MATPNHLPLTDAIVQARTERDTWEVLSADYRLALISLTTFETRLTRARATLGADAVAEALQATRSALESLRLLSCDTCEQLATDFRPGRVSCATCAVAWVPCAGCGQDVHVGESVTNAEGGDYHPDCYGPEAPDSHD